MTVQDLRRVQAGLAFIAPAVVFLMCAWHTWSADFARNALLANGTLIVLVCSLSFCLHKRSAGRETAWFGVRISADQPGSETEPVFWLSGDIALLAATGFFVLVALSRYAAG